MPLVLAPEPSYAFKGGVGPDNEFATKQLSRPNVVVIMADDMREDDLKWMPNVNRLIAMQGVQFRNSFAPYPTCCPSRASFMSGQYAHNHKVMGNQTPYGYNAFDDAFTLSTTLSNSGYATVFLGKYLNGYGPQPPHDGSTDNSVHYVPPGWTEWRGAPDVRQGTAEGSPYDYRDTTINFNGDLMPHPGEYQTTLFGDISARVIQQRASADRPFFLWTSYVAPHAGDPVEDDDPPGGETPAVTDAVRDNFDGEILAPPSPAEADVSDKPSFIRSLHFPGPERVAAWTELHRQRVEALTILDRQVQREIRALRHSGELRNTYVIFTSDNGFMIGEHRFPGKFLPYEESLRVPLLIRGPGISAGVQRFDPVLTIDLRSTIEEAAGIARDTSLDGRSVLPLATNGDSGWARAVLTETGPLMQLPNQIKDNTTDPGEQAIRFGLGLRTSRYLYVRWASQEWELYDVRADPRELVNLVDDPSYDDIEGVLAAELADRRNCSGGNCRTDMRSPLTEPP